MGVPLNRCFPESIGPRATAVKSIRAAWPSRGNRIILTTDGHHLVEMLSTTISVAQAKARFAALVARAEKGERIVVTRNGRPVACLGPLPGRRPINYGELRGVYLSENLSIPEEVIRDFEPSK